MNNKKNVAQLYSEAVQSCQHHRVPTILIVKNQENKDLQKNDNNIIETIKGVVI